MNLDDLNFDDGYYAGIRAALEAIASIPFGTLPQDQINGHEDAYRKVLAIVPTSLRHHVV